MALLTPTLLSTVAFDATYNHTFIFSVTGGDQVVANRLQIMLNDGTDTLVYDTTLTTYRLEHEVPMNTLTNGQYYKARILTFNAVDQFSQWSNLIEFRCFDEGRIDFTNIPIDSVINNSSFNFIAEYKGVTEGDIIDSLESYDFILYDNANIQIDTSGVKYFSDTPPIPTEINHTFNGFIDNNIYGIRVTGTTIYGMIVDTGIINFTADYIYPTAFSLLALENVCEDGYIRIISDVSIIDGVAVPDPPTYIDDKEIDLRADGSSVSWPEGWTLSGDFTVGLWGRQFRNNSRIFLMNTNQSEYRAELYCRQGYPWDDDSAQKMYFDCYVYSGNDTPGYVFSNYIDIPADDEEVYIWLARQGNVFGLKIMNRGVVA